MKNVLALSLVLAARVVPAQEPTSLGAVVVVAERAPTPMNLSTAAVTRLTSADLERVPGATLADVLRRVPGFAVVDFDGSGRDPQLMVRGFYGGGEAEYVLVIVDGRVVNQVHNGTVTWEILPPPSAIESIEIVRGSASAVHGDAAVAGVINIVTKRALAASPTWRLGIESDNGMTASAGIADELLSRDFVGSIGFDRTNGFRDHAQRTSASLQASLRLNRVLRTSISAGWRDFEEPGPLLGSLRGDGTESDPRFGDDGGIDRNWSATLDHDGVLGAGGILHTDFRVAGRSLDLTRTLPLSPDFGDTRRRELSTFAAGLTSQVDLTPTILPAGISRFTFGASADLGTIDSRYFSPGGSTDASGDGQRVSLAAFTNLVALTSEWMRWTFGARLDYLNDGFEETTFSNLDSDNSHFAFSPKMGVNVRYAPSGHAWISASRTFKAPTLDQQFDQRPIPVPFPPFTVTTSNPDLEPQRGTSAEAGLYQDFALASARLGVTLTLYEIAMRNELDFDVQTLRYVNIARSRHRGAEVGVSFTQGITSAFASISRHNAVSRSGTTEGNRLKAVPGRTLSLGTTVSPPAFGTVSLSVSRMADMFMDDANTQRIPAWTRVDLQYSRDLGAVTLLLGARNLFDDDFNSSAFFDPSGSGQIYYYPAAGRVLTIGVRYGR